VSTSWSCTIPPTACGTLRVEVVAERDQTLIIDLRAGTVERRIE